MLNDMMEYGLLNQTYIIIMIIGIRAGIPIIYIIHELMKIYGDELEIMIIMID